MTVHASHMQRRVVLAACFHRTWMRSECCDHFTYNLRRVDQKEMKAPEEPEAHIFRPARTKECEVEWKERFWAKNGRAPTADENASFRSEMPRSRDEVKRIHRERREKNGGDDPYKKAISRRVVRPVHGISHCPQCKTTWKRDDNAALNFAFGFYHILNDDHNERPEHLQRPPRNTSPCGG